MNWKDWFIRRSFKGVIQRINQQGMSGLPLVERQLFELFPGIEVQSQGHALGDLFLGFGHRFGLGFGGFRLFGRRGDPPSGVTTPPLLNLAGIPYTERKAKQSWTRLTRELSVLKQSGLLGDWTWDETPHMLPGRCTITAASWIRDRTIHGVTPIDALPESNVPKTGNEFKSWRKGKG